MTKKITDNLKKSRMNKKFAFFKTWLLTAILLVGSANAWSASTVTYTVASTSSVNTTGTAPEGSSAAYLKSAGIAGTITINQSATLTLSGYAGYKITNIVLSMRSQPATGAGTLSVVAGTTTIASVNPAAAFNTASWYGAWSSPTFVDVTKTPTPYDIQSDENVVITIAATANSLYIQSYTITYETSDDGGDDGGDGGGGGGCDPHEMSFPESIVDKRVSDGPFTNPLYNPNNYSHEVGSSLNEGVAVVTNEGEVTIKGIGITIISIHPTASNVCSESPPSYTLNVYADCTTDLTWNGSVDNDWNNPKNWTPGLKPWKCSNVTIPKLDNPEYYPILTGTTDDNKCANIYFKAGAEVSRHDLLDYDQAYIQYDFGADGLARNQWHLLSMPLQEAVTGDFAFGGYPKTFLRKFDTSVSPGRSVAMGTWTNAFAKQNEELPAGTGFALWVNGGSADGANDGYADKDGNGHGIGMNNKIIDLPYFEDAVKSAYHRIHEYDAGTSTFQYFDDNLVTVAQYDDFTRTTADDKNYETHLAYRLNTDVLVQVEFAQDGTAPFALIGNPYMATLDFETIFTAASGNVKNGYQVWSENGFASYNLDGASGVLSGGGDNLQNKYIAPQQSFLVEKADAGSDYTFTLTVENFTTEPSNQPALRASTITTDKLNIVASNPHAAVLTYIANRENGSVTFGNSDSRKLVTGLSNVPEIYTLKESKNGRVAVGSNVINSDNALIPVGLSTAYTGDIKLTFTGMDSYNARIKFIDIVADKEIDITGKDTFEYPIHYVPAKDGNNTPVATENRFFIQFAPATPTGLTAVKEQVIVSNENQTIRVVSTSSNPIRQLFVYDMRGVLLYANNQVHASHFDWTLRKSKSVAEVILVKVVTERGIENVKLINK
jgi:hypothetical protein